MFIQAGARRSERECVFDINNYVAGEQRVAGHICHLPSSNPRFAGSKIPLPGPAKASSVVGHILHSIPASDEIPIKRLFVEAYDVAFLSADNPSILPSKKISSSNRPLPTLSLSLSHLTASRWPRPILVGTTHRTYCRQREKKSERHRR